MVAGDRPDSAATNILCEQPKGLAVICSNGADGKPMTSVGTMATINNAQLFLGGPIFAANSRRLEKKKAMEAGQTSLNPLFILLWSSTSLERLEAAAPKP